jgi:5-methylcytosine-specific restriction protein B
MSIGQAADPDDAHLFEEAISGGYALLGFGDIDWSDPKFEDRDAMIAAYQEHEPNEPAPNASSGRVQCPFIFRNWMSPGDLVIVSKGNRDTRTGALSGGCGTTARASRWRISTPAASR